MPRAKRPPRGPIGKAVARPTKPLTDQQKVRRVRRLIQGFRDSEGLVRLAAPSRSTGIRNVYKGGYDLLAEIEEALK